MQLRKGISCNSPTLHDTIICMTFYTRVLSAAVVVMTGKTTLQGQLHHYEHSGKLSASRMVTAHNAMFPSIKHLDILIYTAIHVIQDQTQ